MPWILDRLLYCKRPLTEKEQAVENKIIVALKEKTLKKINSSYILDSLPEEVSCHVSYNTRSICIGMIEMYPETAKLGNHFIEHGYGFDALRDIVTKKEFGRFSATSRKLTWVIAFLSSFVIGQNVKSDSVQTVLFAAWGIAIFLAMLEPLLSECDPHKQTCKNLTRSELEYFLDEAARWQLYRMSAKTLEELLSQVQIPAGMSLEGFRKIAYGMLQVAIPESESKQLALDIEKPSSSEDKRSNFTVRLDLKEPLLTPTLSNP